MDIISFAWLNSMGIYVMASSFYMKEHEFSGLGKFPREAEYVMGFKNNTLIDL